MIKLGGIGTILIVVFLFWVLSAPAAMDKIERGCRPVDWFGSVVTSLFALTSDEWGGGSAMAMANATYGCEYVVWRFFYEDDWEKAVAAGLVDPRTGQYRGQVATKALGVVPPERAPLRKPGPARAITGNGEQLVRPIPYPLERL